MTASSRDKQEHEEQARSHPSPRRSWSRRRDAGRMSRFAPDAPSRRIGDAKVLLSDEYEGALTQRMADR